MCLTSVFAHVYAHVYAHAGKPMSPANLYADAMRKLYGGCGYGGRDCGKAKADATTTELASSILVLFLAAVAPMLRR